MTDELREAARRAVHVLTADGRVLRAGEASAFVLGQLGYRRTEALLVHPSMRPLTELGYRIVANHRPFFSRFLFRRERE